MVGIGIAGSGYWGIHHVRVFGAEPRARLVAVCDPDAEARKRAGRTAPQARLTADYADLIGDPTIDAVVLASPARQHADQAVAALEAGKHVLVEKPLSLSVPDAERAVAAAAKAGRVLLVGHLMLYHPAVTKLGELVASGDLGKVFYLYATRVNLGRLRTDENALLELRPHDVAMIDLLTGGRLPISVAARGQSYLQPGVEDVVFVTLRYADGVMAHIHLSWLDPRKERRLTLVCSKKMVEFDDVAGEKLKIYDKGYDRPPEFTQYADYLTIRQGDIHIPHLAMNEPLVLEARHFIDCIEGRARPLSDGASGLRCIRVLAAAQASLERDGAPCAV